MQVMCSSPNENTWLEEEEDEDTVHTHGTGNRRIGSRVKWGKQMSKILEKLLPERWSSKGQMN